MVSIQSMEMKQFTEDRGRPPELESSKISLNRFWNAFPLTVVHHHKVYAASSRLSSQLPRGSDQHDLFTLLLALFHLNYT